jgi:hypothetical protein
MMGVLVSMATLLRMMALGFALGIIVGLYFGLGGSSEDGSASCTDRPSVEHCVPAPEPPAKAVNPDASP